MDISPLLGTNLVENCISLPREISVCLREKHLGIP